MIKKYKGVKSYNVGGLDQQIRYGVGFFFPILALFAGRSRLVRAAMWVIGVNGLLTAYFKFSPLNRLLGISTYSRGRGLLRFAK
ncbi:MAG: DUF2892 domain-containing protein [Nitrospirae bacterium]|nr:DUF2892 domain-containing protein [Candidatus Manganitrophaceae bacterium]